MTLNCYVWGARHVGHGGGQPGYGARPPSRPQVSRPSTARPGLERVAKNGKAQLVKRERRISARLAPEPERPGLGDGPGRAALGHGYPSGGGRPCLNTSVRSALGSRSSSARLTHDDHRRWTYPDPAHSRVGFVRKAVEVLLFLVKVYE